MATKVHWLKVQSDVGLRRATVQGTGDAAGQQAGFVPRNFVPRNHMEQAGPSKASYGPDETTETEQETDVKGKGKLRSTEAADQMNPATTTQDGETVSTNAAGNDKPATTASAHGKKGKEIVHDSVHDPANGPSIGLGLVNEPAESPILKRAESPSFVLAESPLLGFAESPSLILAESPVLSLAESPIITPSSSSTSPVFAPAELVENDMEDGTVQCGPKESSGVHESKTDDALSKACADDGQDKAPAEPDTTLQELQEEEMKQFIIYQAATLAKKWVRFFRVQPNGAILIPAETV